MTIQLELTIFHSSRFQKTTRPLQACIANTMQLLQSVLILGCSFLFYRPGECNSVILSSVVLDDGKKRLKSLIPEMVLYIFMLPPPIYCCTTELLLNEMITYFMYIYAGSVPIPAGNALPISRTIFCDPQVFDL